MNFLDSIKAVLDGRCSEAVPEHVEIAQEVIAAVREHDKPCHEKALEDMRKDAFSSGWDRRAQSDDAKAQADQQRAEAISGDDRLRAAVKAMTAATK